MIRKIVLIYLLSLYFITSIAQSIDSISQNAFQFYKDKDYVNALRWYNELISRNSISDKDLFILGKIYYNQKKYTDAIKVFNELSLKSDTSYGASYWLSCSYFCSDSLNSYSVAKPYYERFMRKVKADSLSNIKELFDTYYFFSAYYLFGNNINQDSAIYYFEKMVMVSPTNKEYLLKGYLGLMYTYLKKKDGAKALYYANKMHEIDPYDRTYLLINDLIEHKE